MQFYLSYPAYLERYHHKMQALYHALRDSILAGMLAYGEKLPSSRELAAAYDLSRGTVSQVYEKLTSQGYLQTEQGRGTFVICRSLPPQEPTAQKACYHLSEWGQRIAVLPTFSAADTDETVIDFSRYEPDLSRFPYEEWNKKVSAQLRLIKTSLHHNGPVSSYGDPALREAIAAYLRRMRGIRADAEHIAVTAGSTQAITLLTQLLTGPGHAVVIESPCYWGIPQAIRAAGAVPLEAELDGNGIVPMDWDASMLFVTPSRQFPTGEALTLERRQILLQWAEEKEAVIVEDDYDSEFRYHGAHIETLKTLDHEDRVVYLGSFTKTLPPGIRLGYVVLPASLAEIFKKAQALYEPQPVNLLEQRALAALMTSGQYERHLRRMNRLYSRKFSLLFKLLTDELSAWFDWVENETGLHIFGWWKGQADEFKAFGASSIRYGVRFIEVSRRLASGAENYGVYFTFAHLTEDELIEGVQRVKRALLS